MDERLPLGSPGAATVAMLLEDERRARAALTQEVERLRAGLPRQNERIVQLERQAAAREETIRQRVALIVGLQEQNTALATQIRGSPVVHADETGWREDGIPGYVWTLSTPDACLFHRDPSRAGSVIDALLTADFSGILVCDFYAAYGHLPGMKQRCWAHLWRDIDACEWESPDDATLGAWVAGVRAIYAPPTTRGGIDPAGSNRTGTTSARV